MEKYPNLKIGDRVVRGPDWEYGEQDSFNGNIGTILHDTDNSKGWLRVKWDYTNVTNTYRYYIGCYDIILYNPNPNLNPKNIKIDLLEKRLEHLENIFRIFIENSKNINITI